jgi:UrcA family protein
MLKQKALKSPARLLLALTAAVMASAPICSHADESESASVTVRYSKPLTPEAARHVYAKIERAANYACGTSNTDYQVIANTPSPCVRLAIGRAIHDTKNPILAQVYIEKNGSDEAKKFDITSDVLTAKR